jgi:hypothetical protein
VSELGLASVLAQAWDYVLFRWDRYVLTYGFNDQMAFFGAAAELWRDLLARMPWNREEATPAGEPGAAPAGALETGETAEPASPFPWPLIALAAILTLAGAVLALKAARRPLTGADAYRRLRRTAGQAGLSVRPADPPLAFRTSLARRFPNAAVASSEIVDLYVRESFAERPLAEPEATRLREALGEVVRVLRKAG